VASVSQQAFIVIEAPNGDVREVPIGNLAVVIGRDESADIRVNDKKVSRRHVAFRVDEGQLLVEDLGSVNGVKLNGRRVETKDDFNEGDIVKFGGYQVTVRPTPRAVRSEVSSPIGKDSGERESISEELYAFLEPRMGQGDAEASSQGFELASDTHKIEPALIGLDPPVKGERFILQLGENIIGRLEDCDIPILDASISRQHARISLQAGATLIEDLNSSNGSFIDDEPVRSGDLAHDDLLRVGSIKFSVQLPETFVRESGVRRREGIAPKPPRLNSMGPFTLIGGLLLLAFLVGSVSWFTQAEKPFTVLTSLFDFGDDTSTDAPPDSEETDTLKDGQVPAPKGDQANTQIKNESAIKAPPSKPRLVGSSTTPFGARDSEGWPLNLPKVNIDFEFDEFVQEMLAKAEVQLGEENYDGALEILKLLIAKDPINSEARRLTVEIENQKVARAKIKKAEALEAKGAKAKAMAIYKSLIGDPRFGPMATKKLDAFSDAAITKEIETAVREMKNRSTWSRAHARLILILEIDPKQERARKLIGSLERKMRERKIRFSPYRSSNAVRMSSPPSGQNLDSILKNHLSERSLMPAAKFYLRGDFERAQRSALRVAKKKAPKGRRKAARTMLRALDRIKAKYERVRTALGNDPSEAWFYFREFKKIETEIIPAELNSFWRQELEASIADAYADQGEAMFVQERYEEAFTKWDAGRKLRPDNVQIEAGLAKLERMAQNIRTEADLLLQQTKPGACDRFRRITKMTSADTDIHRLGRKMAMRVCN